VIVYLCYTSAIVKRYIREGGTSWIQALAHPRAGNLIYLARITCVELSAAITRRCRGGAIAPAATAAALARFRLDLAQEYLVLEITAPLLTDAMRVAEVHGLRAYDAVQLAAALELNKRWLAFGQGGITLVSADQELNAAATAEGLPVEDPSLHP
jgi:predicted nucleic acid-binding protein